MRTLGKSVGGSARLLPKAVVAAGLAGLALCAPAAELVPYRPPASSAQSPAQMQPPTVAPSAELSADEMRKIRDLAARVNGLSAEQKRKVRAGVQEDLNRAVNRQDWHQARYFEEILRQTSD